MIAPNFHLLTYVKKRTRVPQYFFIVFFVVSAAMAGLTLDMFRSYTTETWILIFPKDARSVVMADQVVDNAVQLPRTLSFYDALLSENRDIADPWAGLSAETRRNAWLGYIRTERVGESGIVHMTVFGNSINESRVLTERIVRVLDTTLDRTMEPGTTIRIVDGPYSQASLRYPILWAVAGLSSGLLLSVLFFFLSQTIFRLTYAHRAPALSVVEGQTDSREKFRLQIEEMAEMAERFKKKQNTVEPKTLYRPLGIVKKPPVEIISSPVRDGKSVAMTAGQPASSDKPEMRGHKTSAPSNLPFIDGEFSWERQLPGFGTGVQNSEDSSDKGGGKTVIDPVAAKTEIESESDVPASDVPVSDSHEGRGEPTEEELKRRLNQLLRGEL